MLTTPFRVPLAREYLRQRLIMNAGINPMSGYPLGDTLSDHIDDTAEDRAGRMEYMRDLNQAVAHIAGLIEGCLIRVWRDRNGTFELAPPVSTAQAFYERNGETDDLYFERSEWDELFAKRFPETDLARWHRDVEGDRPPLSDAAPPPRWSEDDMTKAILACGVSNREDAWKQKFKADQAAHGWTLTNFRDHWAVARGTKGMTGRPRG